MINFSDTFFQVFADILPPTVTAVLGWYFGRRKSKADAVESEVENVGKGLELYRIMIDDLKSRQKNLLDDIIKLEIDQADLKRKLEASEAENAKLRKRIIALEKNQQS